jgi:MerR family transcriptional regulator/heat shock protein HspR
MTEQAERDLLLEVAARVVHLTPARVRYYVRAGFVRPSRVEGNAAYYGDDELARMRRIRRLQEDLGLNAAGVEVVLHLIDEIQQLQAALERRTR